MITRYLTRNPCYRLGRTIRVRGLMLHSVGTAQPDPLVFIRQFDRPDYDRACVHGFIGPKETYVTLPILVIPGSAMRGWHGGKTASNDAYLGIEMTEPDTIRYTDGTSFQVLDREATIAHIRQVLDRAEDLFAQLCRFHGLDPLADGIILSHAEGGRRGIATNHADPDHLWAGLGLDYSMDRFRRKIQIKELKVCGSNMYTADPGQGWGWTTPWTDSDGTWPPGWPNHPRRRTWT